MAKNKDTNLALNEADHEDICNRCGVCCHEKLIVNDRVIITDIPCKFLDLKTNLCRVYPDRFSKQPRCSSAQDSILSGGLPGSCPYVSNLSNYKSPYLLKDHPEFRSIVNFVFKKSQP